LSAPYVKEIVPVGSKGIAYEAATLASLSNVNVNLFKTGIDYAKSAGPVTCLLFLCSVPGLEKILACCPNLVVIGEILS
jgi:hypothetical protein